MTSGKRVGLAVALWLVLISFLHATLNLGAFAPHRPASSAPFRVGFIPVTCHLTCPVTDFINKHLSGESGFEPVRFEAWPELKEAFISGYLPATFILAIEESVQLADRVVIMSQRPGTIRKQIEIDLPRPRDLDSPEYLEVRDEISHTMGMSLKVGMAGG